MWPCAPREIRGSSRGSALPVNGPGRSPGRAGLPAVPSREFTRARGAA